MLAELRDQETRAAADRVQIKETADGMMAKDDFIDSAAAVAKELLLMCNMKKKLPYIRDVSRNDIGMRFRKDVAIS